MVWEGAVVVRSIPRTEEQPLDTSSAITPARVVAYGASPLLSTKLHIPSVRPNLVQRPRLIKRVQAGIMGKLVLISAPAGFGKTTLLSAWRAISSDNSMPLAWLSLDADDNDPMHFWRYVVAALETIYPAAGSDVMALFQVPQPPAINLIVTSLINTLTALPTDVALILDDYHLIVTPAIHAAIALLLDHLPPQLHLVMLTRADPPLPLTRLRARGELTEVRAADLRFTADEVATFLTEMMGLPLTRDEVMTLETRTEGWIAGLQLAALAMRDRTDRAGFVAAFGGSNRFVVDYLTEEVLNRLPPHLQTFVLQTAILDQLCGPLCDALLLGSEAGAGHDAQAYSQVVLEELERVNLFLVPLDDERRWYRYHHLFAEVLRARLRSGATVGEVATLYQRASAWYEGTGLIGEAVRYAFLVDDIECAVSLIERHAIGLMLRTSDVLLVQSWIAQVPRALIPTRPQLTLIAGFTLVLTAQPAAFEQLLVDAAPALHAPNLPSNTVGQIAGLRAAAARFFGGDPDTIYAFAEQALVHLAPDNYGSRAGAVLHMAMTSMWRGELTTAKTMLAEAAALAERGGSLWIALAALEELASLQARQGQLREILRTAQQAAQVSARMGGQQLPATGMGLVAIAEVLYERNDLSGVILAATQSIGLLRRTVERLLLVRGYVVLAQVHQTQGDHAGALDTIQRCEAWFAQIALTAPDAQGWLAAHRARLWIREGNLAAAIQWAKMCTFVDDGELHYVEQLTLVQLCLAQSHNDSKGVFLQEAHSILDKLLLAAEAQGWTRYVIECLTLQALVYEAQAERVNALVVLQRALSLTEPEGYIRIFVDAGARMQELLLLLRRQSVANHLVGFIDRLLAAFGGLNVEPEAASKALALPAPRSVVHTPSLVEPLTEREIEVLRLIAGGASNNAIANQLVISLGTVKKHINNLYGKLAVQSRTQALLRARELNLL